MHAIKFTKCLKKLKYLKKKEYVLVNEFLERWSKYNDTLIYFF